VIDSPNTKCNDWCYRLHTMSSAQTTATVVAMVVRTVAGTMAMTTVFNTYKCGY